MSAPRLAGKRESRVPLTRLKTRKQPSIDWGKEINCSFRKTFSLGQGPGPIEAQAARQGSGRFLPFTTRRWRTHSQGSSTRGPRGAFQRGLPASIRGHLNQSDALKASTARGPGPAAQTEPREGQRAGAGPGGRCQLKSPACGPFSPSFSFLQLHCVHWQRIPKARRAAFTSQGFQAAIPKRG